MRVLFVIVFLCIQHTVWSQKETLKVSIYYESLCPDSIKFIVKEFYPSYQKIGSALNVDFVPYGKAMHIPVMENNTQTWMFTCQHGPRECWGNKAQACGLAENKEQSKNVEFVNCMMSNFNPASENAINQCSPKLDITSEPILKCMENGEGDKHLAAYGDQTHALNPSISFVPTIVFNDKYDNYIQQSALNNFLETACNALSSKHPDCPQESSHILSN